MSETIPESEWIIADEAWRLFVKKHPELGIRSASREGLYNVLRRLRDPLMKADALRKRTSRPSYWLAHVERFDRCLFDLMTGVQQ